jgi:hypothetical protein
MRDSILAFSVSAEYVGLVNHQAAICARVMLAGSTDKGFISVKVSYLPDSSLFNAFDWYIFAKDNISPVN